ncbi:MAG: phosphoglucomutase/phosphomannomutase family protein [Chloroflexi bacterium]|nr:phosphoglucomutase/phosphomannomutase family protein [Chloroflexota bacterium]
MAIEFGTDGWRAVISDEFTFENVRRVAWAIGDYLDEKYGINNASVVVGFDTRFLSDRYAIEMSRLLSARGFSVHLSESDCPTPALTYAILDKKATAGIMITASHNPPRYNGIKLKAHHGGSVLPEEAHRVEHFISHPATDTAKYKALWASEPGVLTPEDHVERFNPMPSYLIHVRSLIDATVISRRRPRVVVDSMYGAGRGYIRRYLEEIGCEVQEIHAEMNPGFGGIHPEPIERNLRALIETVRVGGYDLGVATDGDADRIGAVDENGRFVDPHCIISLVLRHLVEKRGWRGSVVKTVSTTQMVSRLAARYGLPLHETPVGFRHISEIMQRENVLIAGEESGGITIQHHIPEGDGILMGLLLAEILAYEKKPLSAIIQDLMRETGFFYYRRQDVKTRAFDRVSLVAQLTANAPVELAGHRIVQVDKRDGIKYLLDDESWLLIRPSGTEPLLRIYAEARSPEIVEALLATGAQLANRSMA